MRQIAIEECRCAWPRCETRSEDHRPPAAWYNPFPPVRPAGTIAGGAGGAQAEAPSSCRICARFPGQVPTKRRVMESGAGIGRVYRRVFKLTRLDPLPYTTRMWRIAVTSAPRCCTSTTSRSSGGNPRIAARRDSAAVHVANEKPIEPPAASAWLAGSRQAGTFRLADARDGTPPKKSTSSTPASMCPHTPRCGTLPHNAEASCVRASACAIPIPWWGCLQDDW